MTAAHDPSMDDILKSIRRIIRTDRDEVAEKKDVVKQVQPEEKIIQDEDNLIRMKIHDQKRLRILEKKLQTLESEYEQKLLLHRRKMVDYRRQNQELAVAVDDYKTKLAMASKSLKSAYGCLEKLQAKNKNLRDALTRLRAVKPGASVLKMIHKEFINLYHPERAGGDKLSRTVRHEIYNEVNEVLQGVRSRLQH
ncbi:MAG: hypothetical protein ACR2Q4_13850 [Geminicoccaceae bacterium]